MEYENSVIFKMTQLSLLFRYALEKAMNGIGLHGGQIYILISLWRRDGQNQIDLVKNLNLAAPTVNKMIKSLSSKGFVESHKCDYDGRMMRVFLTDKGREHEGLVAKQWQRLENQLFADLSEIEKLMFFQLFDKLKDNLTAPHNFQNFDLE